MNLLNGKRKYSTLLNQSESVLNGIVRRNIFICKIKSSKYQAIIYAPPSEIFYFPDIQIFNKFACFVEHFFNLLSFLHRK